MSKGSFRRALLEIDRELASVPFAGEREVRAVVRSRRRITWHLPALALAVAVAALLVVRARDREPVQVAGFTIEAPASSWQTSGDDIEVVSQQLELDVPGFGHVVARRGARVTRFDGGIRVVSGGVDVDVAHRPAGVAPALVRVSHGTIAVLGTRFTIEQSEHGGRVVLHEGRIRFDDSQRSVVLAAGSSLSWPLASSPSTRVVVQPAPEVAPTPPPTKTRPTSMPQTSPSGPSASQSSALQPEDPTTKAPQSTELAVERLLTELANLRSRRRFSDAAALLERALTTDLPSETIERLSYELGDILTYQLTDPARACRHWQSHSARFPFGRYPAEVAAAVRRLACKETMP